VVYLKTNAFGSRLEDINDGKMNNSMSLNPEFFSEGFELNKDFSSLDL